MTARLTCKEVLERLEGNNCEFSLEEGSDFNEDGSMATWLKLITLSAWQLCAVKGAEC